MLLTEFWLAMILMMYSVSGFRPEGQDEHYYAVELRAQSVILAALPSVSTYQIWLRSFGRHGVVG